MGKFDTLKKEVCEANLLLPKYNIVYFTWGNVSVYRQDDKVIGIKPSGISYDVLTYKDIVILDLDGNVLEGDLNPSSDLQTHLELYRNFTDIKSIVHTHSTYACGWAQAGRDIECLGTTHADCFYGNIPCTRALKDEEIKNDYELNTGRVIVETFKKQKKDPIAVPGVLVKNHGPFVWGETSKKAVENAATLEIIAEMNTISISANSQPPAVSQVLLDKHYFRKHGNNAYYGQK